MTSLEVQTPSIVGMLGQQPGHRLPAPAPRWKEPTPEPQQLDRRRLGQGLAQADGAVAGGRRRRRALDGDDAAPAGPGPAIRALAAV